MQTGSWGAPPPRCHAADRAAHVPKTRVRRARCVYGPHTSLRGDTGRGDARSWEQTMDPASTPADHGPPSRACNRAASKNGGRPMHPPAPAQGRSTKALGWCQHHGDRSHGAGGHQVLLDDRRRPPRRTAVAPVEAARRPVSAAHEPACARARGARRRSRSRRHPAGPRRRRGLGWAECDRTNLKPRSTLMRSTRRASQKSYGQFCCVHAHVHRA